jgi:hypothetical protein
MRLLVLAWPPASCERSRTMTRSPSDAALIAAASPAGPAADHEQVTLVIGA